MDEVVIPAERELTGGMTASAGTIRELREAAREYEIYAPQIGPEYGGMGHDFRDVLPAFEAAGRSLLGPIAMRVDAPDEGNMHLLELHGTDLQKEQYLKPLVEGRLKSGFAMTEPIQGGGSDPKMLRTTAERVGDDWVIDGHKWWTTQGIDADILLVFARSDQEAHPYEGSSVFIVPTEAPGVEIVRNVPHMGGETTGKGHAEIVFDEVQVPDDHVLGEAGNGFAHVQERLGPARLTHCMRFSGMAQRALDITKAYLSEREAFGSSIGARQAPRFEIAEMETRLQAARALNRTAAASISAGEDARVPVSMSKVFTANVAQDAIDTAVQYAGGNGIAKDLPLAEFYQSVRTFRIIDGADEVHKRTIARAAFDDVDTSELDPITRFGER